MKKENRSVARHELIGLEVTVLSRHAGWNGLSGTVVDETKHTLVVERASGSPAVVPKSGQRFAFRARVDRFVVRDNAKGSAEDSTTVELRGDDLMFRPEDRTKKVRV